MIVERSVTAFSRSSAVSSSWPLDHTARVDRSSRTPDAAHFMLSTHYATLRGYTNSAVASKSTVLSGRYSMQLLSFVALVVFGAQFVDAKEPTVEFNRDIRPIFSDKCYTCHGPDAANRKTKLRFDVEDGARIELSKGRKAIVPGDP